MNDALFIIGLLVFFFLLWAFTGGPTRPISFSGPYITPITNVDQTQVGYGSTSSLKSYIGTAGTQTRSEMQDTLANDQDQLGTYQTQQEYDAAFGTPSPYKGVVTMDHSVNGSYGNDPTQEYVEIHLGSSASKNVDITGWKLESTVTDNNATIPAGTPTIHQGAGNVLRDIVLYPGDSAMIVSGPSPVNDSYRDNECIGYLPQGSGSYSGYSSSCPSPTDDFNAHYPGNPLADDSCYSFVQTVNRCTVPAAVPSGLTSACDAFIAKYLNYNGCVAAHSGDAHFSGDLWHIFLGHGARLWKSSRDNIKLLDASGRTVDMFSY